MNQTKNGQLDMLHGPLFSKILMFSLPLAATGILQLLFNAADVIVVGKFAGSASLAAVGSTGSLINLLVGAFMGISVGTNILIARYIGCSQDDMVQKAVHTSFALSALLSVIVMAMGLALCEPLLRAMDTPEEIMGLAALYLRIYFLGVPANLIYNFGAAILRAIGDTKRPLWYLVISGTVNVILNLVLVILFKLDTAGVAIATIISQYISLALVTWHLCRIDGPCRLTLRKIRMDWREALKMIQIGLPVGLQSAIFNISNVMIQGAVNSYGSSVIAANSAAANISAFTYTGMNAVSHAAITFTSQNLGAGQLSRARDIYRNSLLTVMLIGVPLSILPYVFGPQLLSVYISRKDPYFDDVIAYGMVRLLWVNVPYFICGVMEVCCGMVRGLGRTWLPMFVSAVGACLLRIVWLNTIYLAIPTLDCLYISYPVSWVITSAVHVLCYFPTLKKLRQRMPSAT